MTSTVEAVKAYLQRDPSLADLVARGLANQRRTARWLIETQGWKTTEDAVVSAMRRYAEGHSAHLLDQASAQMADGRVDVKGGLAMLTLPRSYEVQHGMLKAWSYGARDLLAVIPAQNTVTALVESARVEEFRNHLGQHRINQITDPVSLLQVTFEHAPKNPATIVPVVAALTIEGVQVLEVMSACPDVAVVVPDDQRRAAFDTLSALTSPVPEPTS